MSRRAGDDPTILSTQQVERMGRMRPQQLFDTFDDMELHGAELVRIAEIAVAGDGEAIGDISIGEELAEHLGTEPIHPV